MKHTDIFNRMTDRYLMCQSYADAGRVDFNDYKNCKQTLEFATRFDRSADYLAFQWQDYGPNRGKSNDFSLLWSKGALTKVRYWRGLEISESLVMALAGATGASAGAASKIPVCLLPAARAACKNFLQINDIELLRDERLEAQDCYVLKGSLWRNGDTTLWISKSDYGVRRLCEDHSSTAEEAQRDHEALLADTDKMEALKAAGIDPPRPTHFTARKFVTDYFFHDVVFDGDINQLPEPA